MSERITQEQAALWQSISDDLREAQEHINNAELTLLLRLNVTGKPASRLRQVIESLSGLPYLFTPQSEWIGGDSELDQNHVMTLPHIAKD